MFSIAPYYVEIVDKKKQALDVWSFQPKQSLKDALEAFLISELDKTHQRANAQAKKTYVLRKMFAGSAVSFAGRYHTGHYGFESEIWDTVAKKAAHKRTKVQADMLPFLFAFYFPKTTNLALQKRGLLLLGRFNTMGVRSMIVPPIAQHIAAAFPGVEMRVDKIAPNAVVSTLLKQGQVKKIRLVKKTLPKDFASVLADADKPSFLDVEYVFRLKRKSFFSEVDWIKKFIDSKMKTGDVFTIPEDYAPDAIKVEIVHGAKLRVIDLGNQGKVSPNVDITADVTVDASGHPDAASWLEEADVLAAEIFKEWGVNATFNTKV